MTAGAPSRILIVRTSAMGDIVHTLPLARALRRRFPAARIGWVVERHFAPLLADFTAVDDVLEIALRDWRRRPLARATWKELATFLRRLHAFAPEVVIDAMGNHKSALIAAISLADRRLGARRSDRREPSSALWLSESVPLLGDHAVDRTLSLLRGLGHDDAVVEFAGDEILASAEATDATPPLLIHPGAGWRNKEYPPARWARVANRLAAKTGLPLGVLSGPGEEDLAREIADSSSAAQVLSAPTLESLTAHLRRARLLLAGDTGPLHLARAVGTQVLCVLGPTDPARNGVYAAPDRNIANVLPCSFCYKRFNEVKACLLTIEPDLVAARAEAILAAV